MGFDFEAAIENLLGKTESFRTEDRAMENFIDGERSIGWYVNGADENLLLTTHAIRIFRGKEEETIWYRDITGAEFDCAWSDADPPLLNKNWKEDLNAIENRKLRISLINGTARLIPVVGETAFAMDIFNMHNFLRKVCFLGAQTKTSCFLVAEKTILQLFRQIKLLAGTTSQLQNSMSIPMSKN